ncbi:MAG: hypothetical protein M0Q91_15095 [Methanoregula sp.]|jgi:hypothetical protein|nr:hypothetical protein [Methanoregula sp.]
MAVTNIKMSREEWEAFKKKTGFKEGQPDHIPDSSPAKQEYKNYPQKFLSKYKEKAKVDKEIKQNVEQVRDRQSADYWKERNRENKERERKHAHDERPERDRSEREPVKKPAYADRRRGRRRRDKPGVELPSRGMGRFGSTSHELAYGSFSRLGNAEVLSLRGSVNFSSYADPFGGVGLGGGSIFGGGRRGSGDILGGLSSMMNSPRRSSSGVTGDLAGGIFGAYHSPFAGMFGSPAPGKKKRKVRK